MLHTVDYTHLLGLPTRRATQAHCVTIRTIYTRYNDVTNCVATYTLLSASVVQ